MGLSKIPELAMFAPGQQNSLACCVMWLVQTSRVQGGWGWDLLLVPWVASVELTILAAAAAIESSLLPPSALVPPTGLCTRERSAPARLEGRQRLQGGCLCRVA